MEKFNHLVIDPETKIRAVNYLTIANIDARHELWYWDGIAGESIIFANPDSAALTELELWQMVSEHFGLSQDTKHTVKRSELYDFISFNFRY